MRRHSRNSLPNITFLFQSRATPTKHWPLTSAHSCSRKPTSSIVTGGWPKKLSAISTGRIRVLSPSFERSPGTLTPKLLRDISCHSPPPRAPAQVLTPTFRRDDGLE